MQEKSLAIVAGAGPGLGQALMRRFEKAGMKPVGLIRSENPAEGLDIRTCDLSDAAAVTRTLTSLLEEYGAPKIVVHNTAQLTIKPFLETSPDDFIACWSSIVLSCANLGQAVLGPMKSASSGTFIISGATASLRGGAKFAAFASAKFALRGLAQSMAREYQSSGIHVVHTILDGILDTEKSRSRHSLDPEKMMQLSDLAEAYWQLSEQPRSVWTHEVDFRPSSETF
jgi:NAD(P)-dependent dehydrogenase (short-subunit alcohol dehydrogenase family)